MFPCADNRLPIHPSTSRAASEYGNCWLSHRWLPPWDFWDSFQLGQMELFQPILWWCRLTSLCWPLLGRFWDPQKFFAKILSLRLSTALLALVAWGLQHGLRLDTVGVDLTVPDLADNLRTVPTKPSMNDTTN